MRKKRPFFLLEILIATTLVSIVAVTFLKQFTPRFQGELRCLEEVELQRLAPSDFAEIVEKVIQREIKIEELKKYKRSKPYTITEPYHIELSSKKSSQYTKQAFLWIKKGKAIEKKNDDAHYLVDLVLVYTSAKGKLYPKPPTLGKERDDPTKTVFLYKFYVCKENKNKETAEETVDTA